jgi:probable rRNA maturation factor
VTRGDGATRSTYRGPWRIDLTVRDGIRVPVPKVALVRAVVAAAEAAGAPSPASIGLILSDDHELATLNAAHLGKSGPTDVLSFPLLASAAFPPQQGDRAAVTVATVAAAGPSAGFALPPGRRPHLGDIVISVERAIDQAEAGRGGQTGDVRWSPASELRLLATHGTLHLCGWDHARAADEISMRALEVGLLGPVG